MNPQLQQLLDTDRQFSALSGQSGAAIAFSQYMLADAVMLPNNGSPVAGIAAIYKSMSLSPGETMTWEPIGGNISKNADMGYTWGIFTLTTDKGTAKTGKYLNVWIKQDDGTWKVEVDMGNANHSA